MAVVVQTRGCSNEEHYSIFFLLILSFVLAIAVLPNVSAVAEWHAIHYSSSEQDTNEIPVGGVNPEWHAIHYSSSGQQIVYTPNQVVGNWSAVHYSSSEEEIVEVPTGGVNPEWHAIHYSSKSFAIVEVPVPGDNPEWHAIHYSYKSFVVYPAPDDYQNGTTVIHSSSTTIVSNEFTQDEHLSFEIIMNDLLLWGTVLFIPIGICVIFGLLVMNSRR